MDGKIEFKSQNWNYNKFEIFLREATSRLTKTADCRDDKDIKKTVQEAKCSW